MKNLSQRDPLWATSKLGQSSLTVGKFGCTTTSLSMLSDYFGCYRSPLELSHDVANYTKDGLIIWQNLKFAKFKFVSRMTTKPSDIMLQTVLKDPSQAVILNVNQGQHWVVALSKNLFGNDYTVLDPWTGSKCNAIQTYHDITGAAFFARK